MSCDANDSNPQTNDSVRWTADASGGTGSYSYSWSGTNSLYGSSRTVTKYYSTEGEKTARVTVTSGGHTATATCYTDVQNDNQVLSYTQTTNTVMPLAASVYLSDVPYTGAGDNVRIILFITTLMLWSLFISYYLLKRKNNFTQEVVVAESKKEQSNDSFKVQNDFVQTIELDNKAITDIEDYARMNKILLSSSATEKILKLSRLGRINASDLIKSLSTGEWIAVSDDNIKE